MSRLLIAFVKITGYPFIYLFMKWKVFYENKKEQSRSIKGPAIIVSNHTSLKDFALYLFLFPFRILRVLMAEVLYAPEKHMGWFLKKMGGIYVDRNSYNMGFINESVDVLDNNGVVGVFPEGRLSVDKSLLKFNSSYVLIALKSGAPIIPVYTDGTYHFFKRARVMIGKKIYLSDYCKEENPSKEKIEELNQLVKDKILEMQKIVNERKALTTLKIKRMKRMFDIRKFPSDMARVVSIPFLFVYRVKKYYIGSKKGIHLKDGGIILSNHQSFSDPIALACAFWRRRMRFLAAEVLMRGKVRGTLLKGVGCIKINRYIVDIEAIKQVDKVLHNGEMMIVFPEGSLHKNDDVGQFKPGVILMAYKANVPIIPVYIDKRCKPKQAKRMVIGEPVYLKDLCDKPIPTADDLEMMCELLRKKETDMKLYIEKLVKVDDVVKQDKAA